MRVEGLSRAESLPTSLCLARPFPPWVRFPTAKEVCASKAATCTRGTRLVQMAFPKDSPLTVGVTNLHSATCGLRVLSQCHNKVGPHEDAVFACRVTTVTELAKVSTS